MTDFDSDSDQRPDEKTDEKNSSRKFELSGIQVAASALAAISSAVAASFLGVGGTVLGAGVGSVIATISTALYQHSLKRTNATLKKVVPVPNVVVRQTGWRWGTQAEPTDVPTIGADGPAGGPLQRPAGGHDQTVPLTADGDQSPFGPAVGRVSIGGQGPATGSGPLGDDTLAAGPGALDGGTSAVSPGPLGQGTSATGQGTSATARVPVGGHPVTGHIPVGGRNSTAVSGRLGDRASQPTADDQARRPPRWGRLAVAALIVFGVALGSIAVFEAIVGGSVSSVVRGEEPHGSTIGGLVDQPDKGDAESDEPDSPAATPTDGPSPSSTPSPEGPTPTPSAEPSEPAPSASPPAVDDQTPGGGSGEPSESIEPGASQPGVGEPGVGDPDGAGN